MLELGIKAPDFELPDQNGEVHKLSDYLGKTSNKLTSLSCHQNNCCNNRNGNYSPHNPNKPHSNNSFHLNFIILK